MKNKNLMKFLLGMLCILLFIGSANVLANTKQFSLINYTSILNDSNQPLISTEKGGYLSGERVVISGDGFNEFEQISLSVETPNANLQTNADSINWQIFADAKGRFTTSLPFDSLGSSKGMFILKAAGMKTGNSANRSYDF